MKRIAIGGGLVLTVLAAGAAAVHLIGGIGRPDRPAQDPARQDPSKGVLAGERRLASPDLALEAASARSKEAALAELAGLEARGEAAYQEMALKIDRLLREAQAPGSGLGTGLLPSDLDALLMSEFCAWVWGRKDVPGPVRRLAIATLRDREPERILERFGPDRILAEADVDVARCLARAYGPLLGSQGTPGDPSDPRAVEGLARVVREGRVPILRMEAAEILSWANAAGAAAVLRELHDREKDPAVRSTLLCALYRAEPPETGLLVEAGSLSGGPETSFRKGDLILSVDGMPVMDPQELMGRTRSGGGDVELLREGKRIRIPVSGFPLVHVRAVRKGG